MREDGGSFVMSCPKCWFWAAIVFLFKWILCAGRCKFLVIRGAQVLTEGSDAITAALNKNEKGKSTYITFYLFYSK